jgi:hypothetical protein
LKKEIDMKNKQSIELGKSFALIEELKSELLRLPDGECPHSIHDKFDDVFANPGKLTRKERNEIEKCFTPVWELYLDKWTNWHPY